jgi:hypothetical protein
VTLRHAAALALVGWYLMCPPVRGTFPRLRIDTSAPLSQWDMAGSYDTAVACAAGHDRAVADLGSADEPDNNWRITRESFRLGLCIASDDPRLKGDSK